MPKKPNPDQGNLLSQLATTDWKPPASLPEFDSRYQRIAFDSEWDGVDWHGDSMPVGFSFATENGDKWYLPVGHKGGGNLDKGLVRRWMNAELKGKTLVTLSGKGDIQMTRKFGVDLEELGCKINEVQHKAALLSDQRRSFKMEDLAWDVLKKRKVDIDRSKIWEYPSSLVGPYAEEDAALTLELDTAYKPMIAAEELNTVLDLEDSLIYCVCEMERNGTPLDVNLLTDWNTKTRRRFERIVSMVLEETGMKVNPNSSIDLARLFDMQGLPYGRTPPTDAFPEGQPSFTDKFLKSVDNEFVALVREARGLDSLRAKYLNKYAKAIRNGILYYQLHQLKGDEDYGTISGRFSSSKVNIQQVFDPERQAEKLGSTDYLVRYLFVPGEGKLWIKADASQIEFRLFVHYSRSARLIKIFNEHPETDFHQQVADMCKILRKPAKNINFGRLFGMGRDKMAAQLGLSRKDSDLLYEAYDEKFPETRDLMNEVMAVAKNRGYVKTILGRRARFPGGERIHSSLNRVIQGTAADILKLKLLAVYNMRKALGFLMRLTVHDELGGDIERKEQAKRIKEVLDEPIAKLGIRVPLPWDVKVGPNWGACS